MLIAHPYMQTSPLNPHRNGITLKWHNTAVEGFVFALSRPTAGVVIAAELAAFAWVAGTRAPLRVAVGTLLAAGTLRTWQCLFLVSWV